MPELRVRKCSVDERPAALEILLQHLPEAARALQVVHFLDLDRSGALSLGGLHVCRRGDDLAGAALCLPSPGRNLMVWTPRAAAGLSKSQSDAVVDNLLEHTAAFARENRARFIQALLETQETEEAEAFLAAGFVRLTRLLYLRRNVGDWIARPPAPDLEFVAYSGPLHQQFLDVIAQTYLGSFDCPEMSGVRTMDDVFESHRGQGHFDPDEWFLVRRNGEWVGCLLLAGLPELHALEIAYIAVLPQARGQRLGIELTRQALLVAAKRGAELVSLAVDSRNAPALAMYGKEGFETWAERDVYILVLDAANQPAAPR